MEGPKTPAGHRQAGSEALLVMYVSTCTHNIWQSRGSMGICVIFLGPLLLQACEANHPVALNNLAVMVVEDRAPGMRQRPREEQEVVVSELLKRAKAKRESAAILQNIGVCAEVSCVDGRQEDVECDGQCTFRGAHARGCRGAVHVQGRTCTSVSSRPPQRNRWRGTRSCRRDRLR